VELLVTQYRCWAEVLGYHEATTSKRRRTSYVYVAANAAPSQLPNVHTLTNKPHVQSYRHDLDLLTSAERMRTKYGVDSSSRFPFTARTDTKSQTPLTVLPTHGQSQ